MDLNDKIIKLLETTGLPVEQDEYTGEDKKYIVFTYEDEGPNAWGDNHPIADTAYMQIQLITPKNYNYFHMKEKIRDLTCFYTGGCKSQSGKQLAKPSRF